MSRPNVLDTNDNRLELSLVAVPSKVRPGFQSEGFYFLYQY